MTTADLLLKALGWILAAAYVFGTWAIRRSERWQAAGLCAGCGVETASSNIGGNRYCEACAPGARKNLEVGGQFFALMAVGLVIGLSAMLLEGGFAQQNQFLDLKIRTGLTAVGAMALVFWIHRKMKSKGVH